ncbi:MAG: carbamoyltransferase C-terminal domain-containing protein [Burkholderiales bacterium]
MIILGLQFGHDGSVCVLKDGAVAAYVYREREARVKHAIGITGHEIDKALNLAGITLDEVNLIAIVSTQSVEILSGLIPNFTIDFNPHPDHAKVQSPLVGMMSQAGIEVRKVLNHQLHDLLPDKTNSALQRRVYELMCPEAEQITAGSLEWVGWLDQYASLQHWDQGLSLPDIATRIDARPLFDNATVKYGFHYPVTVGLGNRSFAGFFVNHHISHAASCFFRSTYSEAAVLTHDGYANGAGYNGGLMCYGRGNELLPLGPHHLAIGSLYDAVGILLNLGFQGPAGKLMGLAPYGKPRFFHPRFAGNWYDIAQTQKRAHHEVWIEHCLASAQKMGYDMSALGVKERITDPINVDIAASTQKLFEESYLGTVQTLHALMVNSGVNVKELCLSGGTALNCPSNSRIYRESSFDNIFIEPSCGDDGLAIGSALYVYHHLLGNKRTLPTQDVRPEVAYLGAQFTPEQIAQVLKEADGISFERLPNSHEVAAADLHANKVIAWFEGASECGPRALGHRSILANPSHADNWERVNRIKGREWWRPFAPSVLEEEAPKWFAGLPAHSPHMLFTGQVLSDRVPAIRHVDGSSRIQTVAPSVGAYYSLIKSFFAMSGIPLVLNTSFNGPGEPIIETPEQAIAFLKSTALDALYMGGYRITRKGN